MKAAGDCCVILREERPKDLKILHYVRSFAIAQDDKLGYLPYCLTFSVPSYFGCVPFPVIKSILNTYNITVGIMGSG